MIRTPKCHETSVSYKGCLHFKVRLHRSNYSGKLEVSCQVARLPEAEARLVAAKVRSWKQAIRR